MFSLLKAPKKGFLGMDLSGSQLRIVELSGTSMKPIVERYSVTTVPPEIYSDNIVHDQDKLAALIGSTMSSHGFSKKQIAIALPSALVITKECELNEGMTAGDQMDAIEQEVKNSVNLDIDEIYIDYKIIGPAKTEGSVQVAFAVSKKQDVDDRVGALEIAGLKAKIVDTDHNAILQSVSVIAKHQLQGAENENILMLDIGYERTEYLVFRNEKLIWAREHHMCAKALIESISNMYGMSAIEAKLMLSRLEQYEESHPRFEADVLQPFLDGMANDITRHIEFFNETGLSFGIQHVLLTGCIANIPSLEDTVKTHTHLDTVVANPLGHCGLGSRVRPDDLMDEAPCMLTAVGMALRTLE